MRKVLYVTAALVAAVIFFLLATLPPNPLRVDLSSASQDVVRRTVAGAYHIHTSRSDGAEPKESIAAAAARAGLRFAIFTDHGDGTRTPDPPAYIAGVLCIDGVEISTNGGHYVAIDMPPAPYPLAGEPAAVVEDVARLGGFGIVAHADSRKPELAWRDWGAPFDGLEWLSIDSEWRDESRTALARAIAQYLIRPAPAIASILDRPDATLNRWSSMLRERPVVALAGADAHGGVRQRAEGGLPAGIGPSYEATFRTLSNRVLLERPFTGDAASDARLLLDAIRRGRVYTVIDAIASPALFDFNPSSPSWAIPPGSRVEQMGDKAAAWYAVYVGREPGTPPVPWLLTNPVSFVRASGVRGAAVSAEGGVPLKGEWRIEKDPESSGTLAAASEGVVAVDYRLASGTRSNQFVALAVDLTGVPFRAVAFETQASGPMRLSVQLRFPSTEERWLKSTYVDSSRRAIVVTAADMMRAGEAGGSMPDPGSARSLLFVLDLTNATPGAAGTFQIGRLRLLQ